MTLNEKSFHEARDLCQKASLYGEQMACQKIRGFCTCQLPRGGMDGPNEMTKTTVLLHRDLLPQKLIDHLVYLKLDHYGPNRIKKVSFAATNFFVGSDVSTVHQDAYNKFYKDQVGKYLLTHSH